ncbi:MAG: hypothetical protein IPM81_12300 [Saprospirales bacterium]|nr:hypothetical protein [Saprospirales bacterium]
MTKKFYFSAQAVLLFVCFLAGGSSLWAQSDPGTSDDGFLVKITSPASIVQTLANDVQNCGWVGSSFGPSVTSNFCGDVVWALPDSVGCNPFPAGSLTGKIAMTRRGGCNFSLKVYHAQQAGAIAVIVTNHYTGLYDGPCLAKNADGSLFFGGMAAGDSAAAVTIPSIFIQRFTSEQIDGALKNGETVNVCFSLPKATDAAAAYHYATPVSQVDTLDHLGMRMTNRESSTLFNIGLKAVVETPGGSTTTLTATVDSVAPNANVYTYFPAYLPPAVLGKFKVTYTNDFYTAPEDTLVRYFEHTPTHLLPTTWLLTRVAWPMTLRLPMRTSLYKAAPCASPMKPAVSPPTLPLAWPTLTQFTLTTLLALKTTSTFTFTIWTPTTTAPGTSPTTAPAPLTTWPPGLWVTRCTR